jgi:hypothetical protein
MKRLSKEGMVFTSVWQSQEIKLDVSVGIYAIGLSTGRTSNPLREQGAAP